MEIARFSNFYIVTTFFHIKLPYLYLLLKSELEKWIVLIKFALRAVSF